MVSKATSVPEYLAQLPENRKNEFLQIRSTLLKNLPQGIQEVMAYGMISFVIPHSIYPKGYHCDAKMALPLLSLANQKNFIAVYSMPLYFASMLFDWFVSEYPKHSKTKIDIGKSCLRLKTMTDIPFELIAQLASKVSINDYITLYESNLKS